MRDPHEHFLRRKPWNRAFNVTAIKEFQPYLTARVGQLVDHIGLQKGVVDLSKWIGYFTYVNDASTVVLLTKVYLML